ncbi:MAG: hypothetical protein K2J36_08830 [Ruminococcus sp.]|nr:hypothetical protein [Ruminococcus sp.]MDE6798098.1 hypothetical protein [Ruminococcus sp.]
MAEGIQRDIVVDVDEWNRLTKELKAKDEAIKNMLDEFIKALQVLVEQGFISGTRHNNMKTFKGEVENLRKQLDHIYDSVQNEISNFTGNIEAEDKYTSMFNLGI